MKAGVTIFFITYCLIAGRRLKWLPLDRPSAVIIGAILCVLFGVLTPEQASKAIDLNTLILLFGVMGIGAFLSIEGFFDRSALWLAKKAKTPTRLLGGLIWGAGILSAFVTNDAVCVLATPLVVGWIKRYKLPPLPFLLALCTAANTGSVATLVGNPQNMLCGILGKLSYRVYFYHMFPVAVIGLIVNHLIIFFMFRKALSACRLDEAEDGEEIFSLKTRFTMFIILGTVVFFLLGASLSWTAVSGFALLLIILREEPRKIWADIDWSILLFFSGLFIVVEGLVMSGAPKMAFEYLPVWDGNNTLWSYIRTAIYFLVGSNIVSNVPFILVVKDQLASFPNPQLAWEILAMASTFAGNLTLLGSVANIIVSEKGRETGGIGFWEYLHVGFPLALITTLIGALWLVFIRVYF